jgi:pantoate--beta-alanine ligase
MDVITRGAQWRSALDEARASGSSVGFVPTMGALHRGHGALVERARGERDVVGASIFVNPLQFGSASDLAAYPITLDDDCELLEALGCDLLFAPAVEEMYPDLPKAPATTISVQGAAVGFEGDGRPGHFDGMATVVAMLFDLTGPAAAYFGEKDFQQLCVVRQMVRDLKMPIEVVGCPTVREADGLALSSRNRRLSEPGRAAATVLFQALQAGRAVLEQGAAPSDVERTMAEVVIGEPGASLHYASLVEEATMERATSNLAGERYRLLIAADVEGVRLIDNASTMRAEPT